MIKEVHSGMGEMKENIEKIVKDLTAVKLFIDHEKANN